MCNACGNMCCGSDMFGGCGCDGCYEEDCWSDDNDFEMDDDYEMSALPVARGFACRPTADPQS